MPRRASTLAVALLLATAPLACATGAERLTRRVVPAGLNETLKALNDPENQELLRRLVDLPDIQKAAHDLSEAITSGALDELTDEQRAARLRQLTDDFVRQIAGSVARELDSKISPSLTRAVEDIVGGAVGAALSPANRQQARSFVDAITRTTIATFGESTGKILRDDLGPALQHVLEHNLGPALDHLIAERIVPALKRALDDEMVPAVGRLSREVTRQAVLGAHDAFVELQVDQKLGGLDDDFWARLDKVMNQGQKAGELAVWLLVLVIVALGVWLARSIIVRRHLEQERAASERMLINVLQAIQRGDTDDPTRPPDLGTMLARAQAQEASTTSAATYVGDLVARARAALTNLTNPPKS
ncbi:MAG: hypothetical protein JNL82_02980 [Myxococcales bacterium]|nr:hypothetical protein [Myxococcales bacterium]